MNIKERGFGSIVLFTLLVGIFIVGGGWYLLSKKSSSIDIPPISAVQTQTQTVSPATLATTLPKTKYKTANSVATPENTLSDIQPKQTTLLPLVLSENTNTWKMYENSAKGFRFHYPEMMALYTKDTTRGIQNPSGFFIPMVCQQNDSGSDFDTCLHLGSGDVLPKNPNGTKVRVNSRGGAIEFSVFLKNECSPLETSIYETINGIRFAKSDFNDGAGQHSIEGTTYQYLSNNQCYQLIFAIEETSCDTGDDVDHCITKPETDSIKKLLQKVVSTFEITNPK